MQLEEIRRLDRHLVDIGKGIKLLSMLSWPDALADKFLEGWNRKKPELPVIQLNRKPAKATLEKLDVIMSACDVKDPIGRQLFLTAQSYATAAQMIEHQGSPLFTELSIELYGRPTDTMLEGKESHLEASDHFISQTKSFGKSYSIPPSEYCIPAESVAKTLEDLFIPFFKYHKIRILIEPHFASKAAAGASGIRIRGGAYYSTEDLNQIIHHEGFVHTLSALNGRSQPNLACLGLGAPRTTATQEGLATFAELISCSIDINRLLRIALRIRAIQMALQGADFIEVFQYFLASGQDEKDSFQSTARIFRGGDVRGRICFTKDVVYLQGLFRVHHFLHKVVEERKFNYAEHLMAGRLSLEDVEYLEPYFESGFLAPPTYEPPWLTNRSCLAAYLSYYNFFSK